MRNDPIMRLMRAAAAAYIPKGAFLRRDRADALLVTNAGMIDPAFKGVPGFAAQARGSLIALMPEDRWIIDFERDHPPTDHFSESLFRFAGQTPTAAARALFVRGAKLTESRPSAGEIADFDRAVRNLAAIALRTSPGGGIYALAVLDEMLKI